MTRHAISRRALLGGMTATSATAILAACGGGTAATPSIEVYPVMTRTPGAVGATTAASPTTTGASTTTAPATMMASPAASAAGTAAMAGGAAPTMGMGKPGGALLMGNLGEANSINPFVSTDAVGVARIKMLFDQLVRLKPDTFEPKPGLAKSWKIDGNVFTFTLQDNLKFSDGSDLTTDDVQFTMKSILAKATASPNASKFFNIVGAKEFNAGMTPDVPGIRGGGDAKTLIIQLATPDAAFLANLRYVNPVPAKLLNGKDLSAASKEPFFSSKPVGAGPYMLQSWTVGGDFVMTKNPYYYQKGLPYLDKVTDRVIADAQSLVNALLAGDIDASIYPSPAGADKLRANKDLNVIVPPFAAPEGWQFNFKNPYLAKKEVRMAIAMSLDIKQFAKDSLYGLGQEAVGPIAPGNYAFDKTLKPIPYDLEKAKVLIKTAGPPPGPIEFITNKGNVLREDFLTLTQAQLDKIGIKVDAQAIEFATLIDRRRKKDFQACCINGGATVSPNDLADSFASTGSQNFGNYANPMVDSLLTQANTLLDPEKQKPLYAQVQSLMLDDLPYFFAWYRPYLHVAKKKFAGYVDSADTGGLFYEIENWYLNG